MYRVYREILRPRKKFRGPQQPSEISRQTPTSLLSRKLPGTESKWRRRGLSNKSNTASVVISNSSNDSTTESSEFPKRSANKIVTFGTNPTLESNKMDDSNGCIIFTNVDLEQTSETEETI